VGSEENARNCTMVPSFMTSSGEGRRTLCMNIWFQRYFHIWFLDASTVEERIVIGRYMSRRLIFYFPHPQTAKMQQFRDLPKKNTNPSLTHHIALGPSPLPPLLIMILVWYHYFFFLRLSSRRSSSISFTSLDYI